MPDFAAALAGLERSGLTPLSEPMRQDGLRRVAFRDPELGAIVELMEDGEALPGGIRPRFYDLGPALVYAAVSVRDLDAGARVLRRHGRARTVQDDVVLHDPALEALWGLEGARRETLVVRGGDVYLEVVRYDDPAPRAHDRRLSDQGIMNVAVGFRERERLEALYDRLVAARLPDGARAAAAARRRDLPARRSGHVAGDPGRAAGVLRPVRLRARARAGRSSRAGRRRNQPTRRERC